MRGYGNVLDLQDHFQSVSKGNGGHVISHLKKRLKVAEDRLRKADENIASLKGWHGKEADIIAIREERRRLVLKIRAIKDGLRAARGM